MANRSHHKSFFMPMLCRFSINDTVVKPSKCSDSASADPQSPKLSCIGQIKKRSTNNNITGNDRFLNCKLSASTAGKSSVHSYTKLHRLFSGKNLISPAIIDNMNMNPSIVINNNCSSKSVNVTKRSSSCNGRVGKPIINTKKKCYMNMITKSSSSSCDLDVMRVVTVAEELDPPLPVVKNRRGDRESNVNLWKRRGIEMKTLQIQPIQLRIDHNTNNNNNGDFSIQTSASTV